MELGKLLISEFQKRKRSKAIYVSMIVVMTYLVLTIFYTTGAVGLFDNFMYLYKFSLSYMNYLILPMITLSFLTTSFSSEYKNDTVKYIWTVPITRVEYFLSKVIYVFLMSVMFMLIVFFTVSIAGYFTRFKDSMTLELILRFLYLCLCSPLFVSLSVLPISIITIITKGNGAITNLVGSIYIVVSFFLMKYLQGISPLSSVPHIVWYKNFEGVQNNPNIVYMLANVLIIFIVYVILSLNILKNQDV
ncbi:ABC transporter permease [Streptococcus suis]|uniref:Lantibiotic ABC transporter n=1 Tax=Streptococcus suis TaxID=1307 RepID=A0A0Z8M1R7_STRSU|nr:ABC transporter permease [Streptococcus suis]CYU92240.1 lantibiotic ABC transporter [Streptococcus suis]CYW00844.1 lantibiotic ABC transporter [Streptococcus suis]